MTTTPVPTLRQPPPVPTRHVGVLVWAGAAALLAVAAIAAVAVWQAGRGEEAVVATPEEALPAAPAPAAPVGAPAMTPTIYIVGSVAAAETLRAANAEADVLRASQGEAVFDSAVLTVASAEDEALVQLLSEQDAIRAALGPPFLRVVDLRVAPTATSGGQPADLPSDAPHLTP